MDLTPQEEKLVRPYLTMKVGGIGWVIGLVIGLLILAAGIIIWVSGIWEGGPYFLLVLVVGMVIIEQAWNFRDKVRLARVLQKYDATVRRLRYPEEEEETL